MRIIFAGTPPFAAASLAALHAAGHEIALVLTQPDRPAGRGLKLQPSAVALEALSLGLNVAKPVSLKNPETQAMLAAVDADVIVVAAYGLMLPPAVLSLPRYGCINIHGSRLPRWRGAAPVQRAIEAGDCDTAIDIIQMDAGLDTGAVLHSEPCAIGVDETSGTLFEKLTRLAARTIVDVVAQLPNLSARAQLSEDAIYARKVTKADAVIDWKDSAVAIESRLRAFDPAPGCESTIDGERLKIWRGQVATDEIASAGAPGSIVALSHERLAVQCGSGVLDLLTVQKPGGKRMAVADFLRGATLQHGWRFT